LSFWPCELINNTHKCPSGGFLATRSDMNVIPPAPGLLQYLLLRSRICCGLQARAMQQALRKPQLAPVSNRANIVVTKVISTEAAIHLRDSFWQSNESNWAPIIPEPDSKDFDSSTSWLHRVSWDATGSGFIITWTPYARDWVDKMRYKHAHTQVIENIQGLWWLYAYWIAMHKARPWSSQTNPSRVLSLEVVVREFDWDWGR
jgi:hypothetical protein